MKSLLIVPAVVLGLAVSASAQVRVSQNGQALDANPQLGSGGYNTVNGGVGGVNSQLYVNGQVTGLAAFQGHVPYSSVDQFHAQSGSGAFDTFQRQSVGVRDAMTGQSYMTTPYVSPYTSVPQLSGLEQGQIPMLPRRAADSSVQNAYAKATEEYKSLLPPAPIRRTGTNPADSVYNNLPQAVGTGALVPYTYAPPVDATFGAPRALRDSLTKDLRRVDNQVDRQVDRRVDSWAGESDQAVTPRWNKDLTEPKTGENPSVGRKPVDKGDNSGDRSPSGMSKNPNAPSGYDREGVVYPKANQDVFVDLLVNLQAKRSSKGPSQGTGGAKPAATPGATPVVEPPKRDVTGLAVYIGDGQTVVVHALAGTGADMFNLQMRKAQDKLRTGRYYDAASDFETACLIDSGNPLPRLGEGLATFAAGEPYNAAVQFRRAMEAFPPIMETRMDVASLIDAKTFEAQITALDKRIIKPEEEKETSLVFLATFLHYSANQEKAAKACAKRLGEIAGDDKLMKAYSEFVLTGKPPSGKTAPK